MRGLAWSAIAGVAALAVTCAPAPPGLAQEAPGPLTPARETAPMPVLLLDQERLYEQSAWGKVVLSRLDAMKEELAAENRRIEAELAAEERALTEKRPTMAPADFAPLATAFDARVEEIRAGQEAKLRNLQRQADAYQQQFFEAARPVLAEILSQSGAVAVMGKETVILSLSSAEITDLAIARMDERLPSPPPGVPAPEVADPDAAAPAPDEGGQGGAAPASP